MLQIAHLSVSFGGLSALTDVSLQVTAGEIVSIIGPNGAGKTTLFNAISGVHAANSGRVLYQGRDASQALTFRRLLLFLIVSLITGSGTFLAFHLQALWTALIAEHYVFQQSFPWQKVPSNFRHFIDALPWHASGLPFACGLLFGFAGAWTFWHSARRTPDHITRLGVARTFQNIRLFPMMSVLDNVLAGMEVRLRSSFFDSAFRLPRFWRERLRATARARKLLDFVGLAALELSPAGSLPYGYQRRLEIARALASQPKLLLLDEPAAGLNQAESAELLALIRRVREKGVTVVLIEHDMKVVMNISDRIIVLDCGQKIAEGTPAEIRGNERVINAYLGKAAAHG